MSTPVLELRGIAKEYYGNRVLKGVSLVVRPGTIHALVGENGAGKSTLMNVLFGMPVIRETGGYQGQVLLDGREVSFSQPEDAMAAGIGMVHQEFMLIPGFSVAENIKLNREPTRANPVSRLLGRNLETLDRTRIGRDARAALDRVGLNVEEWAVVAGMPVGHLQFIEIAREVDKEKIRLLIFDEPTAVLTESDAERLLAVMKSLAAKGLGLLFITHRLDEVLSIADDITVLRDGELVGTLDPKTTTVGRIAELMVGRPAAVRARSDLGEESRAEPILEVEHLAVDMPGERVEDVSFTLRKGEILGLAGLAGHGKIGIANGLMGLYPARGTVRKQGRSLALNDSRGAIHQRLAFVSEDRRGVGILPDESIELNIALTAIEAQGRFLHKGPVPALQLLDGAHLRRHALEMIKLLDIRCTGPRQHVRRLSGGNQQKVCLARAMTLEPDTLLVSEPTRGIDIGAKELVLGILRDLNTTQGISLIVTSSELAELRALCDRIAIVYHGRIVATLPSDASDQAFGLAMAGEVGHAHA
ncbi:MAG: sugar ABC transporter ATP-binding protein [Candidatus Eisenbacteria bacterium]|uniref:Sugar ABC transporter ATP-binding protein n=1 Tax=Eiseniibacteriota bacterium TaxID=2212470 RepID=A0A849SIY7_UNCEI|nr:sugar ABC transporter ATP-binding protein [Candidatus Eisenbacteria bacterium]